MKKVNVLTTLAIATLSAPLILLSEPASAGSNGQQLKINISGGSGSVNIVEGYNQDNQLRTWASGARDTAYTNNHWWKGYNKITVKMDSKPWWVWWGSTEKTCTYTIPENQWGDWYPVDCKPW